MKVSPNPQPFRYSLGERGEVAAAALLKEKGFTVVSKNYKCRIGEIDLIAEKKGRIHFIEVKTRSGGGFGDPAEAVDRRKQLKLTKLAEWYLKEKKLVCARVSFDVAAVTWKEGQPPQVRFIEGAFEKPDDA